MVPPTPSRGTSLAPPVPRNAASASRRGSHPMALFPRALAASPPGCPPAREWVRSPRAQALAKAARRRPRSPPRSGRAGERGPERRPHLFSRDRPSPRSLSQLVLRHQPNAHGIERRLGAAGHVQLREDAVHMGLDCTLPDEELARDLLVGFAPSQELQDLRLASGKGLRALGGAHLAHQACRGLRGELNLTCCCRLERPA